MGDVFYIVGIGLTLAALALSFVGIRSERFPSSRILYTGVLGVMAALVAATCAFAVVLAREEQEHREHERAEAAEATSAEEEQAAAEGGSQEQAPDDVGEGVQPEGGGDEEIEDEPSERQVLEVTSPEDGALEFEPPELQAQAGEIEISYTNPSPVPHNVAIEAGNETLTESATVTDGDTTSASTQLEPGDYVFYCAVPGHREAGMEGPLVVE